MKKLLLIVSMMLLCEVASASPWTLPRGRTLVTSRFEVLHATHEFLEDRQYQRFAVGGRLTGGTIALSGRLGMTDRLEFEAVLPLRLVNYSSDPVILAEAGPGTPEETATFYRNNVVDFSQASAGIADIFIMGRYQWLLRPMALATEIKVKAPTGYEGPTGTFGPQPDSISGFMRDPSIVRPENVRDDVTLGDAQLDITASMLAGMAFSTGTFVRGSAGYKLRFGGAGDQVVGALRFGQSFGRRFLIYGAGTIAYAVQAGRNLGITIATNDPDVRGRDFRANIHARPYVRRLAYDAIDISGGFIWRALDSMELNVGYQRTVWGRNVAATDVVSMSFSLTTELFDEDEEE